MNDSASKHSPGEAAATQLRRIVEDPAFFAQLEGIAASLDDAAARRAVYQVVSVAVSKMLNLCDVVDQPDDLRYVLTVLYCEIKCQWIGLNTKMNYATFAGNDPAQVEMAAASALTHVLSALELLISQQAIETISHILNQSIREF